MNSHLDSPIKSYLKYLTEDDFIWHNEALCAQTDPEIFFPEDREDVRYAKGICKQCPVQTDCLRYAMENMIPFGVWGGLTARERQNLRNRPQGRPAHNARLAS